MKNKITIIEAYDILCRCMVGDELRCKDTRDIIYTNDMLDNIAENADSIYKAADTDAVRLNEVWLDVILNLCKQARS